MNTKNQQTIETIWEEPIMIAGPCSAESEEQVLATARALSSQGLSIFRAGVWKPRTKPGGFEGIGVEALQWMKRVKRETGMLLATEVANREHVFEALKAGIDILWIGARTSVNPFAVQEIADAIRGADVPVLVKNPVNPDLELWIGAIERLQRAGVRRLAAIHRGFSSTGRKIYRNAPQWEIPLALRERMPEIPMLCDPSHIAGKRDMVPEIAKKALELGFSGLMVESHCNPDAALSDAEQQLTPAALDYILGMLLLGVCDGKSGGLSVLRQQIDNIDEQLLELLAKRMQISGEIGLYKREHELPVVQNSRYDEILEHRSSLGASMNLRPDFVKEILREIHEESVRQQLTLVEVND